MAEFQKEFLLRLYKEKLGVDVILIVPDDDREIRCHRLLLTASSEYFARRFNGPWAAHPSDSLETLTIPELTFETLEFLIKFLYTNEFTITDKCSMAMAIVGADYLLMDGLKKALELWVTKNTRSVDVCEMLSLADKLSPNLVEVLITRIKDDLVNHIIPEDIGCLDYKTFSEIIGDKVVEPSYYDINTNVTGNQANYRYNAVTTMDRPTIAYIDAIKLWMQSNLGKRQRHVLPLLTRIRFPANTTVI